MKKFKTIMQTENGPCWKTHKMVGMKKKPGRPGLVPNCVPKEENNPRPRKGRMSPKELEIMKLHNYHQTLKPGSQERKNVLNVINQRRKAINKPPLEEAFPAAAVGLALKAAPTVARVVSRGSGAPIGAAATSAYNTVKKGVKKLKKRFTQKEDISTATTTASIPNPAVTAMGRMPTYILRRKKGIGIKMTDNRFNKKKPPVLLARFRKYMADNGSF